MPHPTVLVTGASGTVGGAVARQLINERSVVRALTRDPGTSVLPEGSQPFAGDLSDPESLTPALAGVDSVFLVWPFLSSEGAPEVIDAVARHTSRVVYLSSLGADATLEDNPILRFHGQLEELITTAIAEWTLLRPASFASNALGWAPQIPHGVVRAPFADQRRAMVHPADIASAAVRALLGDDLLGARPVLTGPESLTTAEQVAAVGRGLGRELRYAEQPTDEAAAAARADGLPDELVAALFDPDQAFEDQQVSTGVRNITGTDPISLSQWARENAHQLVPPLQP